MATIPVRSGRTLHDCAPRPHARSSRPWTTSRACSTGRAPGAFMLRCVLEPPFAVRIEDGAPLTLVVMTRGRTSLESQGASVAAEGAGIVVVLRGPAPYTVCSAAGVGVQAVIGPDERLLVASRGGAPADGARGAHLGARARRGHLDARRDLSRGRRDGRAARAVAAAAHGAESRRPARPRPRRAHHPARRRARPRRPGPGRSCSTGPSTCCSRRCCGPGSPGPAAPSAALRPAGPRGGAGAAGGGGRPGARLDRRRARPARWALAGGLRAAVHHPRRGAADGVADRPAPHPGRRPAPRVRPHASPPSPTGWAYASPFALSAAFLRERGVRPTALRAG